MRRSISAVLCAAILIAVCSFSTYAATTPAAGTVTTASGRLNVRNTPGGDIVSTLDKGSNIVLISQDDGWYKVEYAAGKYGYCSAEYIKEIAGSNYKQVKTSSGRLYVRSSPAGSVIDSLASGTKVAVISESSGWSKIVYYGNSTGYVSSAYLIKLSDTTPKYKAISLSVPYYKQTDSRWANHKIGSTNYTIGLIGCTTTALAMTESYRTNTTIYPHKMEAKLTYNSNGALYWPSNYATTTDFTNYLEQIYNLLKVGKPVIVGAKKSNGSQHWVVVTGVKTSNSLVPTDFIINDPGTSERTNLGQFFSTYHYLHRLAWYK